MVKKLNVENNEKTTKSTKVSSKIDESKVKAEKTENLSNEKEILEYKKLHEEAHKEFESNKRAYGAEDMEYRLENNEVYDEAEVASALESSLLSKALLEHKQKMAPQTHPNFDGLHCVDCEVPIHKDRLKMGRVRCTACQEHFEYVEKRKSNR